MITRMQMPRQMYGLGSFVKDRIRKLIPNELASVASKAAPIVAPFNPGVAALMRGIGRFDQRGSISDALKQGVGTFAFGKGVGMLGGAQSGDGFFGGQRFSMEGFQEGPIGRLFDRQAANKEVFGSGDALGGEGLTTGKEKNLLSGARDLLKTGVKALPKGVAAQLAAGTVTAGASLLASYFQGEFEEPEPGESMEDYLVRRREYVGTQMRTYMDNYFANDPEYMKLDDAGRDAFVARYNVKDGGRIGYQTGGISSLNTLAQNIAINRANQAAFNQMIRPAQIRAAKIREAKITPSKITPIKPTPARITPAKITPSKITPIQTRPINITPSKITPAQISPLKKPIIPFDLVPFLLNMDGSSSPITEDPGYFGPRGFVIDGKRYFSEQEAIEDMGVERYNMFMAEGGRVKLMGGAMPTGIMRTNKAGIMERDYRDEGGFVPVGIKEKADDVPAMLSKNEFVMTADAVRGAGNGSIEKGAQKMYDTMKNLERRVV